MALSPDGRRGGSGFGLRTRKHHTVSVSLKGRTAVVAQREGRPSVRIAHDGRVVQAPPVTALGARQVFNSLFRTSASAVASRQHVVGAELDPFSIANAGFSCAGLSVPQK